MAIIHAIVLGLVQGIAEFLPISSSAHLILVPWFMGWPDPGLSFDVFLHMGTLLALFLYFISDWWRIGKAGLLSIVERRIGFDRDRLLFWLIGFGTIPAGLAGLFFHEWAETVFRSPLVCASTLAFVGFLIYWIDGKYPSLRTLEEISFKDAAYIGLAQAFSIIPGVSRAGSTMAMARVLGFSREAAARYSFLLSFPIILAAGVLEGRKLLIAGTLDMPWTYLAAGMVTSFVAGMLSIHFLLGYLRNSDLGVFSWYRILLATSVVLWSVVFHR